MKLTTKQRKIYRVRNNLKKVSKEDRYRLSVSRSSKNISAQIIDDNNNTTILSASPSWEMPMNDWSFLTIFEITSGCVHPQASFILSPLGVLWWQIKSAPSCSRIIELDLNDAPFAASKLILIPFSGLEQLWVLLKDFVTLST